MEADLEWLRLPDASRAGPSEHMQSSSELLAVHA